MLRSKVYGAQSVVVQVGKLTQEKFDGTREECCSKKEGAPKGLRGGSWIETEGQLGEKGMAQEEGSLDDTKRVLQGRDAPSNL